MNNYDWGTTVRLRVVFTDADGTPADPSAVTLEVEDPDGAETSYTDAVKESTGVYYRDILTFNVGVWSYRWEGTGDVQQVDENQFRVNRSAFQ